MNLLYTLSWHGPSAEGSARELYQQLRAATARGERFPFDYPYEVALAHQRPADGEWLVVILAMRGTILDDAGRTEIILKLEDWFSRSGAVGMRGGQVHAADHLKVASELGLDYVVIESFGTFVGEPGPGDLEKKPEVKPEPALSTTAEPAMEPVEATTPPSSWSEALARAAATPTSPGAPTITVKPETAKGCLGWFGGGMIAFGSVVGLGGLLFALLMVIGQFAGASSESSISDFLLAMACFPLPMLLFAAFMIGIGIFLIGKIRKDIASTKPLA